MSHTTKLRRGLAVTVALLLIALVWVGTLPVYAMDQEESTSLFSTSFEEVLTTSLPENSDISSLSEVETSNLEEESLPETEPKLPAGGGITPFAVGDAYVSSYIELAAAITSIATDPDRSGTIYITQSIVLEDTLTLSTVSGTPFDVSIIGVGADIKLTQGSGRHFTLCGGSFTLKNLVLDGAGSGGGLSADRKYGSTTSLSFDNVTLQNLYTATSSAPVDISYTNFTMNNSHIVNSSSAGSGNIIKLSNSMMVMNTSSIANNTAPGAEGVLKAYSGRVTMNSSSYTHNTSAQGLTLETAELVMNGSSRITNNTVTGSGGGVSAEYGALHMNDNSEIAHNTAGGFGGGWHDEFVWGGGGSVGGGGGFELDEPEVVMSGSASIHHNSAALGGGGLNGRAITLKDNTSVYSNTTEGDGGGIYLTAGLLTITGAVSITGNTAGGDGGGVYVLDWGGTHANIFADNVLFSGNKAGNGGRLFDTTDDTLADLHTDQITNLRGLSEPFATTRPAQYNKAYNNLDIYYLGGAPITGHALTFRLYTDAPSADDPAVQMLVFGQTATEPTVNREGYTLLGWYIDGEFSNPAAEWDFDGTTMPDEAVTLYALWSTPNVHTVTYRHNNGTAATTQLSFAYGSSITNIASSISNPGYTFTGWLNTATGKNWNFSADTMPDQNVELVAQWRKNDTSSSSGGNEGGGEESSSSTSLPPRPSTSRSTSTASGTEEVSTPAVSSQTSSSEVTIAAGSSSQVLSSSAPDSSQPGGGTINMFGLDIPRGDFTSTEGWSLFNLLLVVLSLICSGLSVMFVLARRRREREEEGETARRPRFALLYEISAGLGVLAAVAFPFLETLSGQMQFYSRWTLPFIIVLAAQVVITTLASVLGSRRRA